MLGSIYQECTLTGFSLTVILLGVGYLIFLHLFSFVPSFLTFYILFNIFFLLLVTLTSRGLFCHYRTAELLNSLQYSKNDIARNNLNDHNVCAYQCSAANLPLSFRNTCS